MKQRMRFIPAATAVAIAAGAVIGLGSAPGRAATIDIAQSPLASSSDMSVLPNVMFLLDDSGSMAFDMLPDHTERTVGGSERRYLHTVGTCKPKGMTTSRLRAVRRRPIATASIPRTVQSSTTACTTTRPTPTVRRSSSTEPASATRRILRTATRSAATGPAMTGTTSTPTTTTTAELTSTKARQAALRKQQREAVVRHGQFIRRQRELARDRVLHQHRRGRQQPRPVPAQRFRD